MGNKERDEYFYDIDVGGAGIRNGIYFCRLEVGNRILTKKLVIVR